VKMMINSDCISRGACCKVNVPSSRDAESSFICGTPTPGFEKIGTLTPTPALRNPQTPTPD